MPQWDADVYLKFGTERTQPVLDLLHRIRLENPRRIIDLGCGPGNSTAELRRHWPTSSITGLDSSREMIDKARQACPEGMWQVGDAATWQADQPFDLICHRVPAPCGRKHPLSFSPPLLCSLSLTHRKRAAC